MQVIIRMLYLETSYFYDEMLFIADLQFIENNVLLTV